ncbi:hypothetical protein [uncultured Mucilaginibacter sp.]|uniref:hypothetical protein n=1 Tax=uncultured Mucilaginibacter sp. TaxID=797541 RepID=UPI0025DFCB82|nr:hypothetical protein [uncultured Mucilaginibacter sp.]
MFIIPEKSLVYPFVLLFIVLSACKKPAQSDIVSINYAITPGSVPYVQASGVYISGTVPLHDSIAAANVWLNGSMFSLPTVSGDTHGITFQGKDVYVTGLSQNKPVYWKNSVISAPFEVPANYSVNVFGIAVSGNDVYVSGTIFSISAGSMAVYWKNGTINYLSTNGQQPLLGTGANGIVISGSDVYICGEFDFNAVYWKNGAMATLTTGTDIGIAVSGSDVYVLGVEQANAQHQYDLPVYWKNGVPVYLTGFATVSSIAVQGTDVYVAGNIFSTTNIHTVAGYAKNGIITNLNTGFDGSFANAICVNNGNVYVAGLGYNGTSPTLGVYWTNGANPVILSSQRAFISGIVYVP